MTADPRVARLVAAAIGACAGAGAVLDLGVSARTVGALLAASLFTGAGIAMLLGGRAGRCPWLLIAVCAETVALLAAALAGIHAARLHSGPVPALAASRATVVTTGIVTGAPESLLTAAGAALTVVHLRAVTLAAPGRRAAPVDSSLLLFGFGRSWGQVIPGESVSVSGRLQSAEPGDDVAAVLDVDGVPRVVTPAPWWQRLAALVRVRSSQACAGLPTAERSLVPALVVGVVEPLPPEVTREFQVTGLSHLVAVSGENLAVLVAAVVWLLQRIGARRRWRAVVLTLTIVAFVLVARPSPSVVRAALMGAVALIAMVSGRRAKPLPMLAVAVTTMVLVDPWMVRSLGFGLSVSATAGLVLLARPLATWLGRWLPRPVALAVAVPSAAQLACSPLLLLAFHQLTPYAVPANLVAGLAVGPATLLGVVVAALAVPAAPAAGLVAHAAALPAAWILGSARIFAGLPGSAAVASPAWSWLICAGLVAAAFAALGLRPARRHLLPQKRADPSRGGRILQQQSGGGLASPARGMLAPWDPRG